MSTDLTLDDLDDRRIDLATEYAPLEFLLEYRNTPFMALGDLQGLKGKAKAGKSHLLAIYAAILLGASFEGFRALRNDAVVLYIDTEQNRRNTQNLGNKIRRLAGLPLEEKHPRLIIYNLRKDPSETRFKLVKMAIEAHRPHFVILDGLRDILNDFNDVVESGIVVTELMRLSEVYHCAICSVMHTGKTTNGEMRGHAGAELLNKCESVLNVSKVGEGIDAFFKVEQTESRNAPIEPFTFRLDAEGMPEAVEAPTPPTANEKKQNELIENLDLVLKPGTGMPYNALVSAYAEATACALRTAKRHIALASQFGILSKDQNNDYNRRIYV